MACEQRGVPGSRRAGHWWLAQSVAIILSSALLSSESSSILDCSSTLLSLLYSLLRILSPTETHSLVGFRTVIWRVFFGRTYMRRETVRRKKNDDDDFREEMRERHIKHNQDHLLVSSCLVIATRPVLFSAVSRVCV